MSAEQPKRLEVQATRCERSLADRVDSADDPYLASVYRADRVRAVAEIRGMQGRILPPMDLERLFEEERGWAANP